MRRVLLWLPLTMFILFLAVVGTRLEKPSDGTIKSQMVGKPVPDFALQGALPGRPGLSSADLVKGGARVVNIFASWCIPCIAESPQLLALKGKGVPIDAIAIRDRPEDIVEFLRKYGDPYRAVASDPDSAVQLALGSSGVPETFVVDGKGIIRYQQVGGLGPRQVEDVLAAYEAAK